VWAELLHGTAGQCLLSGGHGANPSWGYQDHGALGGLSGDDHTQYVLLAGRSGGQTVYGGTAAGNDLILHSTSNATKGGIFFGASSVYDQVNNRLGIATTSPSYPLHVVGNAVVSGVMSVGRVTTDSHVCLFLTPYLGAGGSLYGIDLLTYVTADATSLFDCAVNCSINSGVTLTNRYGYRILNPGGSGSITNNYALYINVQTKGSTLNYALYVAGSDSYIGGDCGFKESSPVAPVTVNGDIALRDGITAPGTSANYAKLYIDSADGDLKIKFSDGTVKTIATDT
jgi:hypothetical protein